MTDYKHEYYRGEIDRLERDLREAREEIRRLETELDKWQAIVKTLVAK